MVQDGIRLSIVVPLKDSNDPRYWNLRKSILSQDFPMHEMELIPVIDGTSESAKAIGIKRARGEVICIMASDNVLVHDTTLSTGYDMTMSGSPTYPMYYSRKGLDALGRYFALIGGNDPLAYYMGKNDRLSLDQHFEKASRIADDASFGDNCFFVLKEAIEQTDLNNYYHIDNAIDLNWKPQPFVDEIVHDTGGNVLSFFKKRYRYGLQHAFNNNRRWHLVDFTKPKDVWRLVCFIFVSLTLVLPLLRSIRGFWKVRDWAWFLHPLMCFLTLCTYACLVLRLLVRGKSPLSSARLVGQKA